MGTLHLNTPSILNYRLFLFFLAFAMHLRYMLCLDIYSKNYVSIRAKMTNNLERSDYLFVFD
jgi:hypothetical protein